MTLCLNMIVKDESHIIEETLENICQHFKIDYWVISDTGSSDQTVQIIEQFFANKGVQGEFVHEPWQNFSHNRNMALNACLGKSDYILFFDADDSVQGNLDLPHLEKDAYFFQPIKIKPKPNNIENKKVLKANFFNSGSNNFGTVFL